jgi:hypothetical protein
MVAPASSEPRGQVDNANERVTDTPVLSIFPPETFLARKRAVVQRLIGVGLAAARGTQAGPVARNRWDRRQRTITQRDVQLRRRECDRSHQRHYVLSQEHKNDIGETGTCNESLTIPRTRVSARYQRY